jgi:hypothetical protein
MLLDKLNLIGSWVASSCVFLLDDFGAFVLPLSDSCPAVQEE